MDDHFNKICLFVDKELKQLSPNEWSKLTEDFEYRFIVRTWIEDFIISTVWTGISEPFGKPFETGIFIKDKIKEMNKHSTLEEAKEFHLMTIKSYLDKR